MEDGPFLLQLAVLVRFILYVVVAPWLGWRVCDEVLRYLRERRLRRSPSYPYKYGIPPGWVVYDHLDEYMSIDEVARRCGCPASLIRGIIGGKAPLEEEMAHELAKLSVHLNAAHLLKMETEYRLRLAKEAEADEGRCREGWSGR